MTFSIAVMVNGLIVAKALATVIGLLSFAIIITVVVISIRSANTCQVVAEPNSISIQKGGGNFYMVLWPKSALNMECDVTYEIKYYVNSEMRGQATTKSNRYDITNLRSNGCFILNVRIWAISKTGTFSTNYIATSRIETPSLSFLPYISVTKIIEGLRVTWKEPDELATCDRHYVLTLSSDLGQTTIRSNRPQFIVSDDAYCFEIRFELKIMANGMAVGTTRGYYDEGRNIDSVKLKISPDNQEELIVTWDNHRKEEFCSITYYAIYLPFNVANDQEVVVTTPEIRFNISYCVTANLRIITYGLNRTIVGPMAYVDATQYTHIEASEATAVFQENKTLITWERAPSIEACKVTFVVTVLTDRGTLSQNTSTTSIELSEESYCFLFGVKVQSLSREETREAITFDFEHGLSPVFDLKLTAEESTGALIATWTSHEKQEECGVQYLATFWDGTLSQRNLTSQSSITFDILYCITASITVKATSDDAMSEERIVTNYTGLPPLIGQVKNVRTEDLSNESIRITWEPPPYVKYCNIEYKVTIEGDKGTCTGASSCYINLDDPCQDIKLDIVAILLDGEPVSGETVREAHTCVHYV